MRNAPRTRPVYRPLSVLTVGARPCKAYLGRARAARTPLGSPAGCRWPPRAHPTRRSAWWRLFLRTPKSWGSRELEEQDRMFTEAPFIARDHLHMCPCLRPEQKCLLDVIFYLVQAQCHAGIKEIY